MQKRNKITKYLKIFAGVVLMSGIMMNSVFAENASLTAEIKDSTINVNYTETGAGFGTLIYIFDTKLETEETIDEELMDEHLIYAGVGINGVSSFVLADDATYGTYTVVTGAKGMPAAKRDRIVYVLNMEPGIDITAAAAISGATSEGEMMMQLDTYNNKAYIFDLSEVGSYQDLIYELVSTQGSGATIESISASIESAREIATIRTGNETEIAEILVKNKEILGLDDDVDTLAGTVSANVAEKVQGDENIAQLKSLVRSELALAALNNAATSEIIETINKYNDVFGVQFSDKLDKISEYQLEKVLDDIDFTNILEIENIVNTEIENIYNNQLSEDGVQRPGSSNSGGAGGGGGGGGYARSITLDKPTVDIINENPKTSNAVKISDIADYEWAADAINYLYDNDIMTGDGSGIFRPDDSLTREEFVKILIAAFGAGKTETTTLGFTDVTEGAWFKPYIETAFGKGIVTGISAQSFGVGQYITRQDAALMLLRAADAYYMNFEKKQTLVDFTDYDAVSDYARVAVDTLARAQIINGYEDGSFKPQGYITRAEIAKVIYTCIVQ